MSKKTYRKNNILKHSLLRRLVHVVVGNEENLACLAISFFVEQTLIEIGNNRSKSEIVKEIKNVFLLSFSSEEITEALSKLVSDGKIIISTSQRYSLEIKRLEEIRKKNSESKKFEDKIFSDWLVIISTKHPNLSDSDKRCLVSDLQLYLNKIFLQHGAECVTLIYPDEEKVNDLLDTYSIENLDEMFPDRSEQLRNIRQAEFPLFLRQLDNDKKTYFAGLLDGTFVYNLIQVDPQTQKFIQDNYKNYRLYLDTNVLYSLFDLQDKRRSTSVEEAIKLAKSFGMKVVVSARTVDEMKKSISHKKDLLLKSPEIKRELAEVGADISEEENFITAYWRAFHNTGISKNDFIEKFTHVSELLLAKNIPIENAVDFDSKTIEEERKALKVALLPQRKTENVARHDAYHRILINSLRKNAEQKQIPDKYWFLSLDSMLLKYDRNTREKGDSPFVLLPHQLLQILRPFGRRSQDYDAVFFELFSRPQIKSAQGVLPTNLTQKILAKMSGFSDLPPEIALGIILDQSFRKNVLEYQDDDTKLIALVENKTESALTTELKEYKERLEKLELDNQKQNRMKEADDMNNRRTNTTNEGQIEFYKNLAFYISIILFVVVNVTVFTNFWGNFGKIIKCIAILLDLGSFALILRIKWRLGMIIAIVLGAIGVLGFIIQTVDR